MATDWSKLPKDLLISILKYLSLSFEDFVAFSAVCSSWRSAATEERQNFDILRQHLPWLMYVPQDVGLCTKFYSLSKKKSYQLIQPQPRDQTSYDNTKEERVYSSLGWIVTKTRNDISLFNPLSGTRIQLPTRNNVDGQIMNPTKFALSASPSRTSDYIVTVSDNFCFLFWKPGNSTWTVISGLKKICSISDMTFHRGRLYTVDFRRELMVFVVEEDGETCVFNLVAIIKIPTANHSDPERLYIVESAGSLLIVVIGVISFTPHNMTFEFYEVNVNDGRIERVESLGDRVLFLGENSSSFSTKASEDCGGICEVDSIHVSSAGGPFLDNPWIAYTVRSYGNISFFQLKRGVNDDFRSLLWVQPTF